MKVSRYVITLLITVLTVNSVCFSQMSVYARPENRKENVAAVEKQKEETSAVSSLEYKSNGVWKEVKGNGYYTGTENFRFTIDTMRMDVQNVKASVLLNGECKKMIAFSENGKEGVVVENGRYKEYEFHMEAPLLEYAETLEISLSVQERISSDTEEKMREVQVLFPRINLETRKPVLKLTSTYEEGTWTSEDVMVKLENIQKQQRAGTVFYVKKPGREKYEEIPDSQLETVNGTEGKAYLYRIGENGKGTYCFRAGYALEDSNELYLSEEQKTEIWLDKVLPQIQVEQNKEGWTKEDVVFHVRNVAKNCSEITYYVRHDEGEWKKIEGTEYTVSSDEKDGRYQFKAVSAVGETDAIYQNALEKSWISKEYSVFIDKIKPAENNINVNRKSGDSGSGEWYAKMPDLDIAVHQDEGSKVSGYYRIYPEGEENNYKVYESGKKIPILEDGKYTVETYAEDEAANRSEVTVKKINVDTTKPEITSIQFTDLDGNQLERKDIIGYPYITNKKILVTIEAADNLSGVDKIVYKSVGSSQVQESTKYGSKIQFIIKPNFIGKISAYAVDKMGNQSNVVKSESLIEEIKKPVVKIESKVDLAKWQNADFTCDILVQDADSGIEKILYEVNDIVVDEVDYTNAKERKKTNTHVLYFTEESKDSNGDILKITAIDRAGNQRSITKKIYLDKTKPTVTLSGIEEEQYYNKGKQLKIAVEENIYKYAKTEVQIERYVDGNKVPYPEPEFILNGVETIQNLSFEQDGTYVVTVQAFDKAGNHSEKVTRKFVIDQTAPVIELLGVENDYYGDDVHMNVSVLESNYKDAHVKIQVVRELNGEITKNNIEDWHGTGRITITQSDFVLDGHYKIKVSASDKAGNKSKTKMTEFIIDQTAPKIEMEGIVPYQVTNRAVTFKSLITDNNIKKDGTRLQIVKEDRKGKMETIVLETLEAVERESWYEESMEEEGKYYVTISSTDRANNTTKKELRFTIDRTAPMIEDLSAYNGKYFQSFIWDRDINDMIEDITAVESHIFLNGIEYDGNFSVEEDGKYVLQITAEDEMHQSSKKTAEFIVDSTPPTINAVMKNADNETMELKEKNVFYQTGELNISLSDREDWINSLTVNGEEVALKEKNSQYQIPITEKGKYNVEVKAVDLAGNTNYFEAVIECTSKTERYVKATAVAAGGIVVFAIAVGMVYRRKHVAFVHDKNRGL